MTQTKDLLPPPVGRWLGDRSGSFIGEMDEAIPYAVMRRMSVWQSREELRRVLGVIYQHTTLLPLSGGGVIGPALSRDGRTFKWTMWAPQRRVLIDVLRAPMPADDQEDRAHFALTHDIRYAKVDPGSRLTAASIAAWLDGRT